MDIHIFGCRNIYRMVLKDYKVLSYFDDKHIIVSKLNKVFKYNFIENRYEPICEFPFTIKDRISSLSTKVRRLLRSDIRYAFLVEDDLVLAKGGYFKTFNLSKKQWTLDCKIPRGSRPLNMTEISNVTGFEQGVYFGEYYSNPSKEETYIYQLREDKLEAVFTFRQGEINHIHNLIVDQYRDCVWILAGDFEDSAAIYKATDGFRQVEKVKYGLQAYRSCVAYPVEEGLLYATDSQYEQNNICLLYQENKNWEVKDLYKLNGPCIFGTQMNDKFYFSTSVEAINSGNKLQKYIRNKRGPGIIKNHTTIVGGNLNMGFETYYTNKKDLLPFLLFQFGNILFPSGNNKTGKLIFTNIGSKEDDFSTVILNNLNEL